MISIRVPATSANMGPGFDCLGIALNLYNDYFIEEIDSGLIIESCEKSFNNKDNLVYTSMQNLFEKVGYKPTGIKIRVESQIPVSRGLGSSATCILAGVMAANEIANTNLSKTEILQIASEIEGHPDNISPALFGSMVISLKDENTILYEKVNISSKIKFCAIIPDFKLSTEEARAVLPEITTYTDAVYNVSHSCLMVAALTNGNDELIKVACKDKLHQIYRGKLIKNYDDIIQKSNSLNCLGSFLSGAGPTILVIIREDDHDFCTKITQYLEKFTTKYCVKELSQDLIGAVVKNII